MSSCVFHVVGISRIHEQWSDSGEEFLVEAHAEITEMGQQGGEAFRVTIASPSMLMSGLAGRDEIELGRGYMFMNDFNEAKVVAWLQRFVERSGARSWQEVEAYIDRYFDWIP